MKAEIDYEPFLLTSFLVMQGFCFCFFSLLLINVVMFPNFYKLEVMIRSISKNAMDVTCITSMIKITYFSKPQSFFNVVDSGINEKERCFA